MQWSIRMPWQRPCERAASSLFIQAIRELPTMTHRTVHSTGLEIWTFAKPSPMSIGSTPLSA